MRFLKTPDRRVRDQVSSTPPTPSQCSNAGRAMFPFSSRQTTIGKLSDKVLLNIFCYFLDVSPRLWPRLVHTCRKWRDVVFTSHKALQLRLFCTYGTPVQKTLYCWPGTLNIVMEYGGSPDLYPPAPEDENNIMVLLLEQSHRVTSISLTMTSSLLKKLSAIESPLLELESLNLVYESPVNVPVTLPRTFLWSPRLSCLRLSGIALPTFLPYSYAYKNIVDLQLHVTWRISTEEFINVLSWVAQLRSLSLHFPFTADSDSPSPRHTKRVLCVLDRLKLRGATQYLEELLARIDAPRLGNISISSSDDNVFSLRNLSQFVDRVKLHKSYNQAHILSSEDDISVSFTKTGGSTCLILTLLCKSLRVQLSAMARIRVQFSALNVEDLSISVRRKSREGGLLYGGAWLDVIASFPSVKWFHASKKLLKVSLQSPYTRSDTVLPVLHKLYISQPGPPHAPLVDEIVSFMISRRLFGRPVAVEYEKLGNVSETGPFPQQVTIEILSEDILLEIFRHHLGANPHTWHILGWVCQGWRQIVFTSPLGLNLRLYCTYGTPVLKSLDCWPALPIVLRYGGVSNQEGPGPSPSLSDEDNIIAAFRHSGRVSIISLTVTSTLLEKLSALGALEPFSELDELSLLPRDHNHQQLTLPSLFRWGPRLRTLHSTRIAFLSFPQLLSSSHGLVELKLCEIPIAGYFPPESFANALSGVSQLETLSLHFISLPPRRSYLQLLPHPGERVALPALTSFKYRGTSKYLDSFVARINTPRLADIDITFFSQPTMDASQLGQFIGRIEVQTSSLSRADIETSAHAISISFTSLGISAASLKLQISCKQLDWQLSCMAQVCDQFSPFLFRVEELRISTTQSSSAQDDEAREQCLDLVRLFSGARDFRVGDKLTGDVICALGQADREITLLPSLRLLLIEQPMEMNEPSWDALLSFINSRSLSAPVQVNVPLIQCHICHTSFWQKKALGHHIEDTHTYRIIMCSYCADFEWTPGHNLQAGHNDLFRGHLVANHPDVASHNPFIWNPLLADLIPPSELEGYLQQHSSESRRISDIVASSP